MPSFPAIRAGGGRHRLRTAVRRRRRTVAAGLAMAAAALAASAPRADTGPAHGEPRAPAAAAQDVRGARTARDARDVVRAPVRIADAAAVRLLRPGDRVDVLAAARVVAMAAPVVSVPSAGGGPGEREGALIVLAVPRRTAAEITGAAASTPLAVTLC
ncbi:hypothetical protein QMK19_21740 [Streptomyces sp. H10-C2]|uniref:hypothetical protein n=1 Tax=unclassified Streptomyces TaxID=2593676 RepID=UPI0024B8C2B5|nr:MULTISPECIES: hypothetical protein [unclassified Streptomyces]MDJ0342359.1 hypothetical protein [Streptomyces sp. PH10-H1]MDJ0372214.1 hypothetical protein [Streptomyces sp. H10-C2]